VRLRNLREPPGRTPEGHDSTRHPKARFRRAIEGRRSRLTPSEPPLTCAECGREPREDESAKVEWRAYPDVNDDLPVFCSECAALREGSRRWLST
jgi:hypothetical protein